MLSALIKAFGQLSDRATRRLAWRSLVVTAALFAVLLVLVAWALSHSHFFALPALDWAVDVLGGFAALVVSLLLFPGVALLILSFFLEDVAGLVEARHYPDLPPPRRQPLAEVTWAAVKFAAVTVALNLLALPLYGILMFVPPFGAVLFYGLNGYLLGREYFELVALRRIDARQAAALRQAALGRLILAGAVIAFLSSLPFANLLTPVVATAFMVHIFEGLRGPIRAAPGTPESGEAQGSRPRIVNDRRQI
ncbi:MAG: EI24 domain-containing protein [Alphaproteobacteria bacterium]